LSFLTVDDAFEQLIAHISHCLDRHAPLKQKKVWGNQSRFMNKELAKAIMVRSKLKSKYQKTKAKNDRVNYQKQRNLCKKLRDSAIKLDFDKSFADIKNSSKNFYSIIKPYLSNKGSLVTSDIKLVESNNIMTNDLDMANIFNDYYTNIVEYTTGTAPKSLADTLPSLTPLDRIINEIKIKFKNHPSITSIRQNCTNISSFIFQEVSVNEVEHILKSINSKKAVGINNIPPLILKYSASVIAGPLTNIINMVILDKTFPYLAKCAVILPVHKKDDRSDKKNYRPISILSALSKVFERIFHTQMTNYINSILSQYVSAYRKHYSCQHVLIRLIENWKRDIDEGQVVGAVLMDLSKAFDCIPHDLLIAKLSAYGFDNSALTLIYSYLKGRRQSVKVNGTLGSSLTLLSGVPQGSILGPLLFNSFINDFYYLFENATLHGFADDNTLSAKACTLRELICTLENEADIAIKWLKCNDMIANASKFQTIFLSKDKGHLKAHISIDGQLIESKLSVELLGNIIDNKLNFENHIANLCNKGIRTIEVFIPIS